jgi:predicted aspartyl protease
MNTPELGVPRGHWYEIEATCHHSGQAGTYIALADTGASFSTLPAAYERMGIEAGGHTTMTSATGKSTVACGSARVKLLRKATSAGMDKATGAALHDYEDLPPQLVGSMTEVSPSVLVALEGSVPRIGLNLLAAWGLTVDPRLGLIKRSL